MLGRKVFLSREESGWQIGKRGYDWISENVEAASGRGASLSRLPSSYCEPRVPFLYFLRRRAHLVRVLESRRFLHLSLSLPGSLWSFCHTTVAVRSKSERAVRQRKSHTQISTPIRALKTSQTIPGTRFSSTPLYISFIVLRLHKIQGTGFAGYTVYYKKVWE